MVRFIIGGLVLMALSSPCSAQEIDTKVINLSVNIEPHISLKVLPGIDGSSVEISVNTNMSRPYQVFVVPFGPLTDQKGKTLPSEYIKFNVVEAKKGRIEIPTPAPIPLGEQLIYTSNLSGDPDTFTILFHFQAKDKVPVGTYNLNLAYKIQTQ